MPISKIMYHNPTSSTLINKTNKTKLSLNTEQHFLFYHVIELHKMP